MRQAFIDELSRISHDRVYLALLTLLPLLSLLFFTLFFANTKIESLPIVVVNNDHSATSRKIVEMIDATPSVSVVYSAPNSTEAERLIASGKAYAAVIIPHNFEQSILRREPAGIILCNNGTNISTNGFIEKDIQRVVATLDAVVSLKSGESLSQVLPIRIEQHTLFNPMLDYAAYLAPCFMPMMIMIFSILGTVMATTPLRHRDVKQLIGKCLPTTLSMITLSITMLALIFGCLQTPLNGNIWLIIAATIVLIIDYQAIALFLVGLTSDRHLAISLGGGYSVLAFTFSGLTFPTMAMFSILRIASHLFPFTYYMKIMVEQALRGAPIGISFTNLGYMALFALMPMLIHKRL